MDILNFHKRIIGNYKSYIQSFLNIKDPRILNFVDSEISNKKLWPEPLIQFNPTFQKGRPLSTLVSEGKLHQELDKIFHNFNLYRHQEEAILIGANGQEFVVTSGTGSGKSLTYIATIFNHVLKQGDLADNKVQAVIVYPMNALINSQFKEIGKYKQEYEKLTQKPFPIRFEQYTGQESDEQKERVRLNPPHILLTNYVMLELAMTRGGRDVDIRKNFLENMKFLVFDELHTYRGRQGSDVSVLIRRIKAAAKHPITCIGTSATMVSGDDTTLEEQKKKVAQVASLIFGSTLSADQVVNEYLVKSIGDGQTPSMEILQKAVGEPIDVKASPGEFERHPTAIWLEDQIALMAREGVLVRRKPSELSKVVEKLADFTGCGLEQASSHIQKLLEWANFLNTRPDKKKNYLPYRIHQFIAQTGSVYSTLGDQESRQLYLDAGLYEEGGELRLFPMVFSRTSGHELTCVRLNKEDCKILPREFYDVVDEEDEAITEEGYLFIQHKEDEEPIWDLERDREDLPDAWFGAIRKDGTRKLKKEKEERLPVSIWFNRSGDFSCDEPMEYQGWFIPSPLMFDPTSGAIFDARTAEWTKVMKLGGEGRSTATTVLSFETISQLNELEEPAEKQKLLSFADNRQDASLQAGHFNDFIKVGQLRAAITRALELHGALDYATISDKVFECLNIGQEQFAQNPATFPGPKKDNEEAFKLFIMYRILYDLRRSWRVVLPNLEQCALLTMDYKHLDESVASEEYWQANQLLKAMKPGDRGTFLRQIFDFFRKSYALSYSMLEPGVIATNALKIREKLRKPWTLDENERLETPNHIRLEKLSSNDWFSESVGYTSVFGRYIRNTAKVNGVEISGKTDYLEFTHKLLGLLCEAGWLTATKSKTEEGTATSIYQLRVDMLVWKKGDGTSLKEDLIKNRSYKPLKPRPNRYFQKFYKTNFQELKPVEGSEHTGQINNEKRKSREEDFRSGKISTLFCSPTMELGIDISDLSIVHMRNVPPTPANYVQRSGRAGRSGQAALVMVYCSNFSAHDRHYFKHSSQMVAGTVTAPRMDLVNEDLLRSHLNASILTRRSVGALNQSIGRLVDLNDTEHLSLLPEVREMLVISESEQKDILNNYSRVMDDAMLRMEIDRRKPSWFTPDWIMKNIMAFPQGFDRALDRWRKHYKIAQGQIKAATETIQNRAYADDHAKKKEAEKNLKKAVWQRELLLNESPGAKDQSEFSPYRYLAAEGFLPGYNFTRLPIRSFMETQDGGGEFISRPRFVALQEFGPKNVIYHDGAKYRIDRIMLTEAELKLEQGKICPQTGYFLYNKQYGYEVDPLIKAPLQLDPEKHIHTTLLEMGESRAYELQRITCQEEERTRKGYDVQTYFSVDGGFENTIEGIVSVGGEQLLHIHYIPTCRLFKLNLKWRASNEKGFTINLETGFWQSKKQKEEKLKKGEGDAMRDVKLFTTDTANALYIQPVKALGLQGEGDGVITLMYAIKRAIENYFQVEANEIGATVMGEEIAPNILIYEASEGSLGVLSQIMDNPSVYGAIMQEAWKVCFFKDGAEVEGKVLPATYDDLLSYYNQYHHEKIDRNLIRGALTHLKKSTVEILPAGAFNNYEDQYQFLMSARDSNSPTEETFLKYLYKNGLKLPDQAQPRIQDMYVRPDFLYSPDICVFCDGTPHDTLQVAEDDAVKREALKNAGYQVLVWHYKDPLDELVRSRPDIFKKVKQQ